MGKAWLVLLLVVPACADAPPLPVEAQVASAPTSEPTPVLATVVAQKGKVEVQRNAGEWQPVSVGDRLEATDAVRTSEDGEVDIAVNEVKLRIHERSEFAVKRLSDSVIRGRLNGRMESQVAAGRGSVEVEAVGSDAVVKTTGGHFSMIANGRGVVAVANLSGAVEVAAKGNSIQLQPGHVSHVLGNRGPEAPSKALRNVLLAVQWPEAKITNRKSITVSGQVEIGSRLTIAGRSIEAEDTGRFLAQVELKPGKQEVVVVATDVLGRKKRMHSSLTHDAKAPHVRLKDKLWK